MRLQALVAAAPAVVLSALLQILRCLCVRDQSDNGQHPGVMCVLH